MGLVVILLAQLLHGEILIPVGAKSPDPNAQPAKSEWPLKECENMKTQSREMKHTGCVCENQYHICQPLHLSATVNGSIILPCSFSYGPIWEPSGETQIFWRVGHFHSNNFLFKCCQTKFTHPNFQGRVSLAREEGQPHGASVRITDLRESDSQLYFCRVSVKTKEHGKKEWQAVSGTNLTVSASPQQPEGRNDTVPLPLGLLAGVSTGAVLLAAAILLGLVMFLRTQRKGQCPERTQPRRTASREQEEKEAEGQELHCKGATAPPWENPVPPPPPVYPRAQGNPGLVYASLVLSKGPNKKKPLKRDIKAEEETTYAAVRH